LRLSTLPEGRTLWAQAYAEPREQLPQLEQRIAAAVAEVLALQAAPAPPADAALQPDYLAAREAALTGGDAVARLEPLRALTAAQPDFAPAQGLYARRLAETLRRDESDPTRSETVRNAAQAALVRDPGNADAHMAFAVLACRAAVWDVC